MKKVYRDMSSIRVDNLKDQLLKARKNIILDKLKVESHYELIKEHKGKLFINDCNAIDLNACMATIDQQKGNVLWIKYAPPIDRDLSDLKKLVSNKVKGLLCFGEGVENVFSTFDDDIELFVKIKNVEEGVIIANNYSQEGDIIIFSPGSPNYNFYKSNVDWNTEFNNALEMLANKS